MRLTRSRRPIHLYGKYEWRPGFIRFHFRFHALLPRRPQSLHLFPFAKNRSCGSARCVKIAHIDGYVKNETLVDSQTFRRSGTNGDGMHKLHQSIMRE